MNVRYRVELSQTERAELTALLSGGKHAARKLKRAQILLAADAGASDEDIARSVGVGGSTVYRTKQRFVLGNLEAALSEEPRPGASRKLTGKEEALLVATACSSPRRAAPVGRWSCWPANWSGSPSTRAVARDRAPAAGRKRSQAVAQGHVVHSAGRRRIRRPHGGCARSLRRGARSQAIRWFASTRARPNSSARFGSRSRPRRARSSATTASTGAMERPICSSSSTCIGPGARSKSPTAAAAVDFAACMRELTDVHFPDAERIRVVARQSVDPFGRRALPGLPGLTKRDACCAGLEFHYVPKHASWLNMVEIEIGVLRGQCLDRRIDSQAQLVAEIAAWERQRNAAGARIKWMFTTEKARAKMGRAYLTGRPQRVIITVQSY